MSKCKVCDGKENPNFVHHGLKFEQCSKYDSDLDCFVHNQINPILPPGKKKGSIVFCSNDPRAVAKSREVARNGKSNRAL